MWRGLESGHDRAGVKPQQRAPAQSGARRALLWHRFQQSQLRTASAAALTTLPYWCMLPAAT